MRLPTVDEVVKVVTDPDSECWLGTGDLPATLKAAHPHCDYSAGHWEISATWVLLGLQIAENRQREGNEP